MKDVILVLGAGGQIGSELVVRLGEIYGNKQVVATDVRNSEAMANGPFHFEIVDATQQHEILKVVDHYKVTQIYNMVAMLSATAEKYPQKAWELNMVSHLNVLEIARLRKISKVFWPSSIAAFGPTTPKIQTPQYTLMDPTTVYGISKLTGEYWCQYYHTNYGIDVRSVRYPGIISWKTKPGGGTTDYAVEIFFKALEKKQYTSFLDKHTRLPMMYMDDAIEATLQLMQEPEENIKIRTSYNLAAIDFTPQELAAAIKKEIPEFSIAYRPDFRQEIANTWPQRIDDAQARKDWSWGHSFDLEKMTKEMLKNLRASRLETV